MNGSAVMASASSNGDGRDRHRAPPDNDHRGTVTTDGSEGAAQAVTLVWLLSSGAIAAVLPFLGVAYPAIRVGTGATDGNVGNR
jgi:hypothetical protein